MKVYIHCMSIILGGWTSYVTTMLRGQKQSEMGTEMYFSFFLSWYTIKMTPQSTALIITTTMAGTSTNGSSPTPGGLRASKAENILCINSRLSPLLHIPLQQQCGKYRLLQ